MKQMSKKFILVGLTLIILLVLNSECQTNLTTRPPQGIWPNFFCHRYYDHTGQKTFPMSVIQCKWGTDYRAIIEFKFNLREKRSCMLWRLGAIIMHPNRTFEFDDTNGLRKTLLTIFGLGPKRRKNPERKFKVETFVTTMLQDSKRCKPIFNEVANVQKLSSEKWTPFYDCIEEAWEKHVAQPKYISETQ